MNIAIIGAGNVGAALAKGLSTKHQVTFGVRNPQSAKSEKASKLTEGVSFQSIESAAAASEVIIITTPPEATLELIREWGDVSTKVLIDATNSFRTRPEPYATAFHALKAQSGSKTIVKCFNTTGFENMADPRYPGVGAIDMFCAGDNAEAKKIAQQLAADIGFGACWDFGGDDRVELLEKFALSWINLAIFQGNGRDLAFKIVRRSK